MADADVRYDYQPVLPTHGVRGPSIAQLKSAISGSAVAAKYPAAFLNSATKNDLVSICRVENISVAGI